MNIVLDVVDSMSNTALPGATISVNGSAVGQTDNNGVYQLSCDDSDRITVSYVGYSDYSIAAGIIEGTAQIQLAKSTDTLPTVTVTPSPKTNILPWLIGGAAALFVFSDNKKSVGSAKSKKTGLLIGAGALGLGAVYLISKKATPAPVYTTPLSTSQMVANKAAATSNPLSALSSLFPSLSNLFGGSSVPAAGTPGSFTPVGIDESGYSDQQPIAPITATDPGSGMSLDFSSAPGMNGIGARYTGQKFAGIGTGARYNLPKVRESKSNIGDLTDTLNPAIIVGGIGALLLFSKKKSKVSGSDFSSYILPLGIVGGGAYLLYKTGLFGNSANAQNNDQTASGTNAANSSAISTEKAAGGFTTYSAANLQSFANDIYNNLQSGEPNQDQVVNDVIQANTLLDWLTVKQDFGTKSFNTGSWLSLCALAQMNCTTLDLDAALKASLDSAHINTINNYFSSQGINYTL